MKNYFLPLILCIFIMKLLSVFYLIYLTQCTAPEIMLGLASMSGDANAYITPIDNYIHEGHYYFVTAPAGRMPYLGLVYYPFRLLFSKQIALSIVVILQVLMEAIAICFTARLCANLLKNQKAFWIFIVLSVISLYVTIFSYSILSESFCISFLCLFAYHYYNFLSDNRTNKQLLKAGFFLALSVLFRPYLCLLFILIGLEILWFNRHHKFTVYAKKTLTSVIIVSLPLLVLDAPWTIRNYKLTNKFIPFQQDIYAGYNYSPAALAVYRFIQTIGESYISWDKRSAGCYFEPKEGLPCEYEFPDRIFSATLTRNKIEEAKNIYLEYQKHPSDSLGKLTVVKFNTLSEAYKKERPFFYYFITPVFLCKKFLLHSGSYYLPVKKDSSCYHPFQWILKLSQSFLYYLCLLIGFTGTIMLLRKNPKSFIIFLIPIYLIILFPLFLRLTEFRYFHPAYPFLLIGVIYFFSFIHFRKQKYIV